MSTVIMMLTGAILLFLAIFAITSVRRARHVLDDIVDDSMRDVGIGQWNDFPATYE